MSPSFSLNILKLLSGKVAVQVLSFITVPILTRLFLPEHFGVIQIFDSISLIIIVISGLRYELSIPLARDKREALASLVSSGLITLMFTVFVLGIVSVGKERIAAWFKVPELQVFLWFLPIFVLAGGIRSALEYWATREGQFGATAWSDVGHFSTERFVAILWGTLIKASVTGLFVGRFIGTGIGIGIFLLLLKQRLLSELKNTEITFKMLQIVIKRHKQFPIFNTWTVFLNSISVQLLPLVFGTYFSPTIVGYYALGYRTINLPMTMFADSISKVFFPASAKEYNELGTLNKTVSLLFTRLVQIGVFPMAVVVFVGPVLFDFVFGQQWTEAGVYAQMLSVWYFIAFIHAPLTLNVFIILNRQELCLLITIYILLARAISLVIGVTFASSRASLGIFVTVSVCSLLMSIAWQLRLAHISVLWAFKTITQYIVISCMLLLPVKLIAWIIHDVRFVLGTLGCVVLCYGIILLKIDRSFREFISTILGRFGLKT